MFKLLLLRMSVFMAAFLLFQIELIVSKAILPGFGGSYLVWGACVLFFQTTLLVGYGYAHLITSILKPRGYGAFQALAAFLPLLFFGSGIGDLVPTYSMPFIIEILWMLAKTIGPAFLSLATVSVMSQKALADSDLPEAGNPYFLYGVSNLGSFLGLFTYPFLAEPLLDLDRQLVIWKGAYLALALLQALALALVLKSAGSGSRGRDGAGHEMDGGEMDGPAADAAPDSRRRELARWFLFSAAGSAMLLAVTNMITFELASVPLFWMLPLCIYLLSFFLNFKQKPWCPPALKDRFFISVPLGIFLFMMMLQGYVIPPAILLAGQLLLLFLFCMFCQNELIEARPASSRDLTRFYFAIAAGGSAGSALVSWAMPYVSVSMMEYLAGFVLVYLAIALGDEDERWRLADLFGLIVAAPLLCWPLAVGIFGESVSSIAAGAAGISVAVIFFFIAGRHRSVAVALLASMALVPFLDHLQVDKSLVFKHRNFYGIYRVYDKDGVRYLRHGATLHGSQYLGPERAKTPMMYYHPSGPAGELFTHGVFADKPLALVGLGTGSLAVYVHPDQTARYYELDPDNLPVAREYFTYLDQCPGDLDFVFGDARLRLRQDDDKRYGLIVIDAFNSDSIPVHLITVEAIAEYNERLQPGGALLFHVSNRYVNLEPVLEANCEKLGLHCLYKTNLGFKREGAEVSEWMVVTADKAFAARLVMELGWTDLEQEPTGHDLRPWTDRYSNLVAAILAKE